MKSIPHIVKGNQFKYEIRGTKDEVAKPEPSLFAMASVETIQVLRPSQFVNGALFRSAQVSLSLIATHVALPLGARNSPDMLPFFSFCFRIQTISP